MDSRQEELEEELADTHRNTDYMTREITMLQDDLTYEIAQRQRLEARVHELEDFALSEYLRGFNRGYDTAIETEYGAF